MYTAPKLGRLACVWVAARAAYVPKGDGGGGADEGQVGEGAVWRGVSRSRGSGSGRARAGGGRTEAEEARQEQRCGALAGPVPARQGGSQANSRAKPRVNWLVLPTAGWKGEAAAACQTSASGLDMVAGRGGRCCARRREAAQVSSRGGRR